MIPRLGKTSFPPKEECPRVKVSFHKIRTKVTQRITRNFAPTQTAPRDGMVLCEGYIRYYSKQAEKMIQGDNWLISQETRIVKFPRTKWSENHPTLYHKNCATLCPTPIILNCLFFCRSGPQLFMAILYAWVQHIIDMSQRIQMSNAAQNQLECSNYIPVCKPVRILPRDYRTLKTSLLLKGGSVRIEPSQQLLDDCTHKRNSKRKVGKPIYH